MVICSCYGSSSDKSWQKKQKKELKKIQLLFTILHGWLLLLCCHNSYHHRSQIITDRQLCYNISAHTTVHAPLICYMKGFSHRASCNCNNQPLAGWLVLAKLDKPMCFLFGCDSPLFNFDCVSLHIWPKEAVDALCFGRLLFLLCAITFFCTVILLQSAYMLLYTVFKSWSSCSFIHILAFNWRLIWPASPSFFLFLQVQTADRSDWLECSEGATLESLLQDMTSSNRCVFLCVSVCHKIFI